MKSAAFLLTLIFLFSGTLASNAQTQPGPLFTVSTLTDRNNPTAKVEDCSLREAITAAGATGQPAVIIFAPALKGNLTLSSSFGPLSLSASSAVTILGTGARNLAIVGSGSGRVLQIAGGPHIISDIAIRSGKFTLTDAVGGGGILNNGNLTLKDCAITGHQATAEARFAVVGGAFYNKGILSLLRCTVSGNSVVGGNASSGRGGDAMGGALYNTSSGDFTADQCTFSGNTGIGGSGAAGSTKGFACGTIYNLGTVTLKACTISGNTGTGGVATGQISPAVGGIWNYSGHCYVTSTILAGNTAAGYSANMDARGSFDSLGFNLVGSTSGATSVESATGFSALTDITGTANHLVVPLLGTLQNNGGQTDTMLPQVKSPALDHGKRLSQTTDQRQMNRLYDDPLLVNTTGGDGTDIGSVEYFPTTNGGVLGTVSFVDGGARVAFKAQPGARYQVQRSDDLVTFIGIGGLITANGLGEFEYYDEGPLPEKRFYRAMLVP